MKREHQYLLSMIEQIGQCGQCHLEKEGTYHMADPFILGQKEEGSRWDQFILTFADTNE